MSSLRCLVTLLVVNLTIVAATAALEALPHRPRGYQLRPGGEQLIVYDNVKLVAPGREAELYADLKKRTALDVVSHRVERIDLLREVAEITIGQNGLDR